MRPKLFAAAIACMVLFSSAQAQTFTFFYYDTEAEITGNYTGGAASGEPGFHKVEVTGGNVATFKTRAPSHLVDVFNKMNTPGSRLRASVDRLTSISNATVTNININMVNDKSGLQSGVAEADQEFCRDYDKALNIEYAWPCAVNAGADGNVWFGELAAKAGDFESTLIHEVSHTQSLKDPSGENSSYGRGYDYVGIAYGGDQGHYKNELQGDEQAPMDEAFGNFWGGLHDQRQKTRTISDFRSNQQYLLGSHSVLTGTAEMWDAPNTILVSSVVPNAPAGQKYPTLSANGYNLTLVSKNLTPGASRYEARLYRFCDVPSKYLFHSELLTELYLYMFHEHAFQSMDTSLAVITRFASYYAQPSRNQRHRYPSSMMSFLANEMEDYRAANSGSNEKMVSSIFAIGLYDLLTHFDMSDDDLARLIEISSYSIDGLPQIPKTKAGQQYFSVRPALKTELMKALYGGGNCKSASTNLDIQKAAAALKAYCMKPETLSLTE